MPDVVATSPAAIPMQALAKLVAASATFQGMVGAGSAAAALAYVLYDEADDRFHDKDGAFDIDDFPQRAIIDWEQEEITNPGTANWKYVGSLLLTFEFTLPTETYTPSGWNAAHARSLPNTAIWFANQYGAIVKEMRDAMPSDMANYLQLRRLALAVKPGLDLEQGYRFVSYLAEWF